MQPEKLFDTERTLLAGDKELKIVEDKIAEIEETRKTGNYVDLETAYAEGIKVGAMLALYWVQGVEDPGEKIKHG